MAGHKIYASSNGDRWFLIQLPDGQPLEVEHRANAASGGAITRHFLSSFLAPGHNGPEHQALRDMLHYGSEWPKGAEAERLIILLDQLRLTEQKLLACRSEFGQVVSGELERHPLVSIEGVWIRLSGITQLEAVLSAMHRALEIERARVSARLGSLHKSTEKDASGYEAVDSGRYDSVEP
jgi:hypothetical protein